MDCWYSRYSGVTALLLATTSAAPTKLKTVMTAGERARRTLILFVPFCLLRETLGNLNQLCRRGRFAPPESRVCRPVPRSSLRPELRRERTDQIELRIPSGSSDSPH